jgi:CheY-like chemotaxis protein
LKWLSEKEKENELPRLIIADYNLPDGTGLDLVEKALKMGMGILGIILTAYVDSIINKIEGMSGFMAKMLSLADAGKVIAEAEKVDLILSARKNNIFLKHSNEIT